MRTFVAHFSRVAALSVPLWASSCASLSSSGDETSAKAEAAKQIGDGMLEDGRYAEALASFQEALRIDPGHAPYKMDVGRAYYFMLRYPEAVRWTREACEALPEEPSCWNDLALFELKKGDAKASEAAARKALSFDTFSEPEKAESTLARALLAQGRLKDADRHAKQAITRKPEDCSLRCVRAQTLLAQNEFEEALFQTRWAVRRCPFEPRVLAWEAYTSYAIGQHQVARTRFRNLVARFSGSPFAEYAQRSLDALAQRRRVQEPEL